MAKEVEKGRHISVLVEQAFPTCILVSYKDAGKTFRGVLLHETSNTVTRASICKAIDKDETSSNLCLTGARAVTYESNEPPVPASQVSTRSSIIVSQDQDDDVITPVHKIRGLVKKLTPRKRRSSKIEATSSSTEPQPQTEKSPPQQRNTLMISMKRKRTNSNSGITDKVVKLNKEADESLVDPKLTSSHKLSPLFPVLKLRRAAGSKNKYVAVSLLSENNDNTREVKDTKQNDKNSSTTEDSPNHKHNTRFKGKNGTGNNLNGLEDRKSPGAQIQEGVSLLNGESLVEVFTKQTAIIPVNMLDEEPSKLLNTQPTKASTKRGLQPRNHNQEMRVGDIVWGKVHGHPWWPGRVLGILCHASESDAGFVKVAWYGSTTTSEISCSFLMMFQENFKQLFKKQKSGAYRRGVREAQQDLQVMSVDGQVLHV